MNFYDLHTHILPGVDDGAQDLMQAQNMLLNAAASDVSTVVVTPHCGIIGPNSNLLTPELKSRFTALQEAAADIPVKLLLGAEVRITDQTIPLLQEGLLPTINGSRYLLTEFPADFPEMLFPRVLEQLLSNGVVPLVAHPERYEAICKNPMAVAQWVNMGCHIQLTGGSITGKFGSVVRRACETLLDRGLVCCVASDAHDLYRRSNFLADVYDHLSTYYSKQCANILMTENPRAICNNQKI